MRIYTPVVDERLNDVKFIVPGLGDFGDRLFGTRLPGYASVATAQAAFDRLTRRRRRCQSASRMARRFTMDHGGRRGPGGRRLTARRAEPDPRSRAIALDEVMGRVSFGEAVYLLLVGELPTPAIGRLMDAMLVALIDHGTTPPSTLAARNVATAGAPLRASVAAGVLGFGTYHGGDIEGCMRMLEQGVELRAGWPLL